MVDTEAPTPEINVDYFTHHAAVMAHRLTTLAKKAPKDSPASRFCPADPLTMALRIASEMPPGASDEDLIRYLAVLETRTPSDFTVTNSDRLPDTPEERLALANRRLAEAARTKASQ